jgi:hypothetical protein
MEHAFVRRFGMVLLLAPFLPGVLAVSNLLDNLLAYLLSFSTYARGYVVVR